MKKKLLFVIMLFSCMLFGQTMQGNYTVGGDTADFNDLDDAITALQSSTIINNVYLYLNPGTYTGPYLIENLNMHGNELYISSGSYASAEVIFTNHAATSQDNYILLIKNSSNIRIDDFDFSPSGQFSRSIVVSGDSNHLTFSNNRFFNSGSGSSNNESIYFVNEGENDADDVTIEYNQFFGGSYHVQINSTSYINNFSNWTIQANVHNEGYQGISLNRGSNLVIYANTMTNVNQGISIGGYSGSLRINRNRLNTWAVGLAISGSDFTTPTTPNVYNNIIRCSGYNWYGGYGSANATGLSISSCEDVYAAHNSIELSSPSSGSIAAIISGTKNIFRKNQFVNLGGGYALNFINTEPETSNRNLVEFNNIYARSTNLGRSRNTYYCEMDQMIVLFGSYNADFNPFYEDAYLRTKAPRLDNLGLATGIDVDFFDNPRDPVTPDIGAHEYTVNHLDPLTTPMEGSYDIGTTGNFSTVNEFAQALSFRGVNGPVTAYLIDATYNEQLIFDRIPGIGWDRLLTVRRFDNPMATITYSDQADTDNYVVQLYRSKYIKFQNITFATQSTGYSNILVFDGFAKELEFVNCDFIAPNGISPDYNSYSIFSDQHSALQNIRIFGGSIEGNGTGLSMYASGLKLSYNAFLGCGAGAQLNQAVSPLIEGNSFTDCSSWGLSINGISEGIIIKNRLTGSKNGFVISNASAAENRTLIANNLIYLQSTSSGSGLIVGGTGLNVLNNTIYLSGNPNSSALYLGSQPAQTDIVNNVFVSMDGLAVNLSSYSPDSGFVLDYNCYYTQSNYLLKLQSSFADLAALQSTYAGINAHSVRYNPLINDVMQPESQHIRAIGQPRSEFDDDIAGVPRGEAWDLGAWQQLRPTDLAPLAGIYTVGGSGFDFESLEEALQAVQYHGIDDHTTLNLQPGSYHGGYIIEDFPRASPSMHLTISGLESSHSFTMQPDSNLAAENFFFEIRAAGGVILSTMHLQSNSASLPLQYIRSKGRITDTNIRHITFDLPNTSSIAINTDHSIGNDILIEQCTFNDGGYGFYLNGDSSDSNRFASPRIYLNTFNNVQYPVKINKANNLDLSYNTMTGFYKAAELSNIGGTSSIFKNRMITTASTASQGLFSLNYVEGSPNEPIGFYQNIIYLQNYFSYQNGLYLASCSHLVLAHNTLVTENNYSLDYGAPLVISNSSSIDLVNNVISSPRRGVALDINGCSDLAWNANSYYSTAKDLGRVNGVYYAPLQLITEIIADPLASYANSLIDENGYNTCSYLEDRGASTTIDTDIDNQPWIGLPDPGANLIADTGTMITSNKQIGPTGDYPDFATAIADLINRGVDNDISIWVQDGTYPTHVALSYIPGTLGGHYVSFKAVPGVVPTLTHSSNGASSNYIIKASNLENTSLEGLKFHTLNPNYGTAIELGHFNSKLHIHDCHFVSSNPVSFTNSVTAIYGLSVSNRNLRIENNSFQDMAYGVYLYDTSGLGGYEIKNNTISNAYIGLYLYEVEGVDIWGNEIASRNRSLHLQNVDAASMRSNKIFTSAGDYVLYNSSSSATTGTQEIFNNYLRGNVSHIAYLRQISNAKIYHNTFINDNTSSTSTAFMEAASLNNLDFRNNICQAEAGIAAYFALGSDPAHLSNNLYWSGGSCPVKVDLTTLNDLTSYQSLTGDFSSLYADALLNQNSYLLTASSPAINAGTTLMEVPFDIDGNLRELPDIGCSEFLAIALDPPQNLRLAWQEDLLTLFWDTVPGATSYRISVSESPDFTNFNQYNSPINSYSLNPVSPRLFFRVVAVQD